MPCSWSICGPLWAETEENPSSGGDGVKEADARRPGVHGKDFGSSYERDGRTHLRGVNIGRGQDLNITNINLDRELTDVGKSRESPGDRAPVQDR